MALAAVHRHPGENWSVDRLAAVARLSRSRFSYRFKELLSVSPARYMLEWRLRLAASWLRNEYMSLSQVAEQLGYESDASFSRAFKRLMGVPPGAARERHRASNRSKEAAGASTA
jgi:AraC-like DNA-binding protein